MTVAVDTSSIQNRTATTDPYTWSHTGRASGSGGVQGVLVFILNYSTSTDQVNTVTYGGQTLTKITQASDTSGETTHTQVWFLGTGVPDGTQTVSVDFTSATGDDFCLVCVTLTGAADIFVVDFDQLSEDRADPSVVMSTANSGMAKSCMAFCALAGGLASVGSYTMLSGMTAVQSQDTGQEIQRVDRQTSVSTSNFTIGYTSADDDVSFVALNVTDDWTQAIAMQVINSARALYNPTVQRMLQYVVLPAIDTSALHFASGEGWIVGASLASDTFNRDGTSDWNTADVGGAWTESVASAPYSWGTSVSFGGFAYVTEMMTPAGADAAVLGYLTVDNSSLELTSTFSFDQGTSTPDSGSSTIDFGWRQDAGDWSVGGADLYTWECNWNHATGLGSWDVSRWVNGAPTSLGSGTNIYNSPTRKLRVVHLADGTLKARSWNSLSSEPGTWDLETDDSTTSSGSYVSVRMVHTQVTFSTLGFYVDTEMYQYDVKEASLEARPAVYGITKPPAIASSTVVYDPSIPGQADYVVMQAVSSAVQVYDATIVPGSVSVAMQAITDAWQVYDAKVWQRVLLDAITESLAVYDPTVVPGSVTVQAQAIASLAAAYNPTIVPGAVTVVPQAVASVVEVYNPTIAPGLVTVVAQVITETLSAYDPTIVLAPYNVGMEAVPSAAAVYDPVVVPPAYVVVAQAITEALSVYDPTVTVGAVSVVMDAIASAVAVYNAAVASYVGVPLIGGGAPSAVVTDTFTDTDATALTAHTPDSGGSWTRDYDSGGDVLALIYSNRVTWNGGWESQYAYYRHSQIVGDGYIDCNCSAVVRELGPTWLRARINTSDTSDFYEVQGNLGIDRVVNGAITQLAWTSATGGWRRFQFTGVNPTALKAEARATQGGLGTGWQVETTDSTLQIASGYVGVQGWADEGTWGEYLDSFDDFTAYAIGGGPLTTVYNPKLWPLVQPPAVASIAALYDPTVIGTQVVEAQLVSSAVSVYDPTVVAQQYVVMEAIASLVAAYNPTISPGAVTVVAQAIASAIGVYDPAVVLLPYNIAMQAVASAVSVYDPTVVPGSVAVGMQAITESLAVYDPDIVAATGVWVPEIGASTVVYDPQVLGLVAMQAISESLSVYDAKVISHVQPPTLQPQATPVFSPTVALAPYNIAMQLVGSPQAPLNPTILPGAVAVAMQVISEAIAAYDPTIVLPPYPIVLDAIASAVSVYAPSVSVGPVNVAMQAISSSVAVYNAAVTVGVRYVVMQLITTNVNVRDPKVIMRIPMVYVIDEGRTVYNPTVTNIGLVVRPQLISPYVGTTGGLLVDATTGEVFLQLGGILIVKAN